MERLLVERIETTGWLIEDEQAGTVHEREHQPQLLLVAARILAEAPPEVELQALGDLGDPPPVDRSAHAAEVCDDLAPTHAAELRQLTGQVADFAFHRNGIAVAVEPENRRRPRRCVDESPEEPVLGRVARAVGSEKAEPLAFGDLEVEVEESMPRPVVLAEPVHDDRAGHLFLRFSRRRISRGYWLIISWHQSAMACSLWRPCAPDATRAP